MNIFDDFKFDSLIEFVDTFNSEQKCITYLEEIFWNGNPISPYDKTAKVYKCANNRYKCGKTKKYFTIKSITIFKNSNIKLRKWFVAIWLYSTNKGGLASTYLQRELKLTQKTTWNMLKKIRDFSGFENKHFLSGEVEVDETYVGGKNKNRHANKKVKGSQGRSHKDKVPVFGMIERSGKVVARVVESVKRNELEPIILKTVELGDVIFSDEWLAYDGLHKYYKHYRVNHLSKQYVDGDAHTNNIENFWSQLKRGIIGVYRVVSKKYLQFYVNEFVLRRNTMNMNKTQLFIHLISNVNNVN